MKAFCTFPKSACGCGNKVMTPLGPTEWAFEDRSGKATLRPSVGNWQLPCQSHYVIANGNILWAKKWSAAQIAAGRRAEETRRQAHYEALVRARRGWFGEAVQRLKKFLNW
jgi:Family of unknown function (DUF6527)